MSFSKSYQDLRVGVSGLHTGENPQPGVPVVLSLRHGGFQGQVVGLVYDSVEAGIWAGVADDVFQLPYPSDGSDAFLNRLQYIGGNLPVHVLIPTLDAEIAAYIRLAPKLAKMGIATFLPTEEQFKLRAKSKLGELSERLKIRVPRSMNMTDPAMAYQLSEHFAFPLMVKGPYYDAYRASTPQEVVSFFHKIRAIWGLPVVIQEYLKGEEYNMVAVGDGEGGCIGSVCMRKTIITEKGKAFGGVVVQDPKLNLFGRKIIEKLSWRGPLELEILKAQHDRAFYLIEINPRFPAWVQLATHAGQNLPLAVLKLALGEKVGQMRSLRKSIFFVRHTIDITSDMSLFGELSSTGELRNINQRLQSPSTPPHVRKKTLRKAVH
jgi:carbamoyl-phosphate synthase large subunit